MVNFKQMFGNAIKYAKSIKGRNSPIYVRMQEHLDHLELHFFQYAICSLLTNYILSGHLSCELPFEAKAPLKI
jgi:hypothetical protein